MADADKPPRDDAETESGVQVKGAAILPRFHYLAERAPGSLDAVVQHLPEPYRSQVLRGLFPDVWYPLELFTALNRAIDQELGDGDGGLFVELGRHSAQQTLSTIYGMFYERGNPMYLFERAQPVWNQYYSSGRVEIEGSDDPASGRLGVRLSILDFASPRRSVCGTVLGWMERAIEFAGGLEVEVSEPSCAVRGDAACVLVGTWRLAGED